jgi:AcrR family transcriptional regulator
MTDSGAEVLTLPRSTRGEARRAGILGAARDVFLERGFEGATLDEIVRRAGGSRTTIYEQFGSKEGLFAAIIAKVCEEVVAPLQIAEDGADLEETLYRTGRRFLDVIMNPYGLGLYRLVVGASGRFPELGKRVYAAGPKAAVRELAAYFRREATRSDLSISDPDLAAAHFLELVKGDLHTRALFSVDAAPPGEAEIDACVRDAVHTFLYGIRSIWRPE